jgi:hypothetical protein
MSSIKGEIIYESKSKGTKVYCNDSCLTKTIEKDSIHYKFFQKELMYYRMFSNTVAPCLISSKENRFTTEFLKGGVLKEYVKNISEHEYFTLLKKVINKIETFNSPPTNDVKKTITIDFFRFVKAFVGKFSVLLLSGPKGTKPSAREKSTNKFLNAFLKPIAVLLATISFLVLRCSSSILLGNRFHGDLHLNNIVLDKNKNVYLIDFENVEEFSGKFIDLLFFYSIFTGNFNSCTRKKLTEFLYLELKLTTLDKFVWKISAFMMILARKRNSRFK